jgi:hypothetical protein
MAQEDFDRPGIAMIKKITGNKKLLPLLIADYESISS